MWYPPIEGWTNLGFCRWWLHVDVEDVDAECWCRSLGAIHLSELHFQYLHGLVPQGTNRDIHRHRVMHTQDDVHEIIWLPCPLPYQHEGLWLLELVQDVEVDCTCSCHKIWVKNVGGVTLKNSLVLLLWDPHHLDGNPWSCSCTWWSRTWCSLGNPLDQGLRCFFKCINLLLKLVLSF